MENKNILLFVIIGFIFLFIAGFFQERNISGRASKTGGICIQGDGYVEILHPKGEVKRYEDRCIQGGLKTLTNYCTTNKYGKQVRAFREEWCDPGYECRHSGICNIDMDRSSRQRYGLRIP